VTSLLQMMTGSALLMSVFGGLDQVACASQETREPSRHVPSALPFTTTLLFIIMLLATSALTLACSWDSLDERVRDTFLV
jgi:amino acid transporter